jgi:DNA polymerase IV
MPRVLLADCDAMFCAVARLEDPEGAGRAPILIVGGAKGSRGVVCSASSEARAFGVRSGMPIAQAERLCPAATFAPVPRGACGRKSREVRTVLEEWAPVVEPASIDEFYLGLDGTEALYRHEPLERTAERIREDVLGRTGLAVSIGGGTNRLIAKLAVAAAKPRPDRPSSGVHVVAPGEEAAFVAGLDLADLPGVGPRLAAALRARGLVRVREGLALERWELEAWLGVRTGRWLYDRMRGIARARVAEPTDAKSVSRERTFETDLAADLELERELLRLAVRVAADLRAGGLRARTITVKLRDFDFRTRNASRTLPGPVATDRALVPVVLELLGKLRAARRVPVRLLGVGLSHLSGAEGPDQLGLFGEEAGPESEQDRAVARAVDRIRGRFGRGAIQPGRLLTPPGGSGASSR